MNEPDPLNEALREATLAVLLGSTSVPHTVTDDRGNIINTGIITIPSAFGERIRQRVMKGEFDEMIDIAMVAVRPVMITKAFEEEFAKMLMRGLESERGSFGQMHEGWLQSKAKEFATEACKEALAKDEDLQERLRTMIGSEVDRNRVSISVQLSNPEK